MDAYNSGLMFWDSFLVFSVGGWVVMAFFTAFVASEKRRCTTCWLFNGLLFGPVALIAAVGVPDLTDTDLRPSPKTHVTCPDCAEMVRKAASKCPHCQCKLTPTTA